MATQSFIYLASQSPRRRELLEQIGVSFRLLKVDIDESRHDGESARDYVQRLAEQKAIAGWGSLSAAERAPVLGADTAVVIDGEILGKPAGPEDASRMLTRLSGRTHDVLSAVCINDGTPRTRLSRSRVSFRPISDSELAAYCASAEPLDKAGAYGIQGRAAVFVSALEGSYSGVMGLPLYETAALLSELGIEVLSPR